MINENGDDDKTLNVKLKKLYNNIKNYNNKITKNYNNLIEDILIYTKKDNSQIKNLQILNIEQEVNKTIK